MEITAEAIKKFRESRGLNQTQFGEMVGLSRETISNYEIGGVIPKTKASFLKKEFEKIEKKEQEQYTNKNGNVFTTTNNGQNIIEVPILPFEAYAKYLDEHNEAGFFDEYEKVTFAVDKIGKGNYLGFRISGDSMNGGRIDDTPDKAIVLGRELQKSLWMDGFHESRHGWIILTNKNILFKDIVAFDKEKATILCHSRNESPEYCDFPLLLNDVYQIFKVIKRTF